MIKKYLLRNLILLTIAIFSTGCGFIPQLLEKNTEPSDLQLAQEMGQVLIDAFINKDENVIYDVLSEKAKNFGKIKKQISEAFKFIDGEIISYELANHTGGGGSEFRDGELLYNSISSIIRNIKTDTNHKYQIIASYVIINKENPETLGISSIVIGKRDNNGNATGIHYIIGY